jgi:hypothetical protein
MSSPIEENYYWTPLNGKSKTKSNINNSKLVSELVSVLAIDNSGSTSGKILSVEKKIANSICNTGEKISAVIAWSDHAKLLYVDQINSSGGTDPCSIFTNTLTKERVSQADVFYLFTDGQIDTRSVNEFSKLMTINANHIALVVCILVGSAIDLPANIDISVFIPAMTSNGIILFVNKDDDKNIYLLYAQGQIKEQLPPVDVNSRTKWQDLSVVNVDIIKKLKVNKGLHAPPGFVKMLTPNIEDNIYINVDLLIKKVIDYDQLKMINMEQIFPIIKSQNKVNETRSWLQDCERYICDKTKFNLTNANGNNNNNASMNDNDNETILWSLRLKNAIESKVSPEEIAEIRNKFIAARNLSIQRQREINTLIDQNIKPIKHWFQELYSDLNELQVGSYSLESLNLKSNRAKRAGVVEDVDITSLDQLDYTDAFIIECEICAENNPACLMMRQHPDPINNTNDFALNFPLACGKFNQCILPSQITCIKCSQYLWSSGKDAVRVDVTHALPIVSFKPNINRGNVYKMLSNALVSGKQLGHLWMLYFAIIDQINLLGWCDDTWKKLSIYVREQISQNLKTRDTLTDEGVMVVIGNAFLNVTNINNNTQKYLMRQPLQAVLLILRNIVELNLIFLENVNVNMMVFHARMSLVRLIVSKYLHNVFISQQSESQKQQLLDLIEEDIFKTIYGIPQYKTTHTIEFEESRFMQVLFSDNFVLSDIISELNRFAMIYKMNVKDIMDSTSTLIVMWSLRHIVQHQKLENTIDYLISKDNHFMQLMDYQSYCQLSNKENKDAFTLSIIEEINKTIFTHRNVIDATHRNIPEYVTPYGPSVCTCSCGYDFRDNIDSETKSKISVEDMISMIKENRKNHFIAIYGSEIPDKLSYHIPLHKIVRNVIIRNQSKDSSSNANEITEQLVLDIMMEIRDTRGNKGNIYYDNLESDVRSAIKSYYDICSKMKDTLQGFVPVICRYELEVYGKSNNFNRRVHKN